MLRSNSLTRGFLIRYTFGVVFSILLIGLFWLYSSHQELITQTDLLQDQAVQRQMTQLKERVHQVLDTIQYEQQLLDTNMRQQIRQRTLEAYALIESIYQNSKADHSQAEIAEMVRNSLRAIKYNNGRGYYFAIRMDGVGKVYPPKPELEGTSSRDIADSSFQQVVQEMISLVRLDGEGFHEYNWPKLGSNSKHRKLAYIKYFAPLDWFVGTGEYIEDLTADLQREMIERIEKIRFKEGGYIFVGNYQGLSLAYPAKDRNMWEVTDNNGVKIVQELIKLAQSDGGYLRYVMPPLEGQRPETKISYTVGVPEWGWYIGSGDFVADLNQEISAMLARQEAAINKKMLTISVVLGLFLLLGIILSRQLGKQVDTSFQSFQNFFARAASQAKPLDSQQQKFTEFRELAESANRMLEERHFFEQEASQYRDQLRNMIDAMPSILVTITPDGQVQQWNRFAESRTGISQGDAIGAQLSSLLPYLEPHLKEMLAATCEKQQVYETVIQVTREGETRDKAVYAYPLGSPQPHSIVIRIDDITERRLLEKTLVQSEKMLSVGGLAAGMAHEVNNPLALIMQALHLLRKRLSTNNPRSRLLAEKYQLQADALQQYLDESGVTGKIDSAVAACERAAIIVKNMLNFSRDGQSDFKATDLCQLLDSTLELLTNDYQLKRKYGFRTTQVIRKYATLPAVVCEASKIQQVLFNLLKNGAQAMEEGNIPPDKRRFEIELLQEGDNALIRIADSGPGIPKEIRERIFEPFFTTKEVGRGTGLGLFVAYFIIHEIHGGDIQVESSPGAGTTFTIKLPLQQPAAQRLKSRPGSRSTNRAAG